MKINAGNISFRTLETIKSYGKVIDPRLRQCPPPKLGKDHLYQHKKVHEKREILSLLTFCDTGQLVALGTQNC